MKKTIQFTILLFAFCVASHNVLGQIDNGIFERLNGLKNQDFYFYSIDGYEISSLKMRGKFTKKKISKRYRKLKIKAAELNQSDSTLPFQNYLVHKSDTIEEGIIFHSSYYFFETQENEISAITFSSYNEKDIKYQKQLISLILSNKIPDSIYSTLTTDTVNFAGRPLFLGSKCNWMNINNIQCSGLGQMNWNVCKDKETADRIIEIHRKNVEREGRGKAISDELVDVIFEGINTQARKIVWDFTGITSALVGMTGGKTLTIYFVSAPVRGNYISCVMSFWNNDLIEPSGLSPLLEEVMQLK